MSENDNETGADDVEPKTNQLMRRGFDGVALASENAATQALVAKATADIQARWVMAMRCPRDLHTVRQDIIKECRRPGFAKVALYHVPRGNAMIHGLSIRFAEVAMRCMGNMSCEAQTLFDSREERVIRVIATDFETNVTWPRDITVKKTVERKYLKKGQRPIASRVNSYGDQVYIVEATDDEVATKEAALISKAARTAILRLIPGHIQDEAKTLCEQIAKDEAAKDPDAEANKIFDAFSSLNVGPADIEQWLGHPIGRSTPYEIMQLRALFNALRDGETSWQEALEAAQERNAKAKSEKPSQPAGGGQRAASAAPAAATDQKPAERRGGKGAAAVKDAMKAPAQQAQPQQAKQEQKPSSAPAPAATKEPATAAVPNESTDDGTEDYEEVSCAKCGVPMDVPKGTPKGAQCYACRNS